ncbi:hypothetical protein [Arthrobacter sp. D2-10]
MTGNRLEITVMGTGALSGERAAMSGQGQDLLGVATPDDSLLTMMVSQSLGRKIGIAQWEVEVVSYPFSSPATAGLFRVHGSTEDGQRWSLFGKQLQHPRHWAGLSQLPEWLRDDFAANFPWRMELQAWEPTFTATLPPGLRVPVLHQVVDLGEDRLMLWMEDVHLEPGPWDTERFARAGYLLGRLAARRCNTKHSVRPGIPPGFGLRRYVEGRVMPLLPTLDSDDFWSHPLIASSADPHLRSDLAELARRLPSILDRLDQCPQSLPHGDASPQNLLPVRGGPGTFALIDIAFQNLHAVGFDLGQLLIGLMHAGELPAASASVIDPQIISAFSQGLADEGLEVSADELLWGHHGSLLARAGFTAFPFELLSDPPTPALHTLFGQRTALTRYIADAALALN